jgi:hypothetical protein
MTVPVMCVKIESRHPHAFTQGVVHVKKLLLIGAAAAGYVLGTKAGRERYEQIKRQSSKVWNSEPVQHGVHEAEDVAKQAASAAGTKVADAASTAGSKVAAKVKGDDSSEPTGPSTAGGDVVPPSPSVTAVDQPAADPLLDAARQTDRP